MPVTSRRGTDERQVTHDAVARAGSQCAGRRRAAGRAGALSWVTEEIGPRVPARGAHGVERFADGEPRGGLGAVAVAVGGPGLALAVVRLEPAAVGDGLADHHGQPA